MEKFRGDACEPVFSGEHADAEFYSCVGISTKFPPPLGGLKRVVCALLKVLEDHTVDVVY